MTRPRYRQTTCRDRPPPSGRSASGNRWNRRRVAASGRPPAGTADDGEPALQRNFRRLSARAFTATMMLEPDIERAATSGRSVKPHGSKTPAAIGRASEL